MASYNGHVEVVRALLAAKADLDAEINSGQTTLAVAVQNGK